MPIDNNNMFSLTGINKTTDELVVMDINSSTDNVSLHSSSNTNNIDTLNIKNILHKDTTKDLNLSAYDGTSINPIIQINNTHQHVNIMSNLNVASNLNVNNFVIKKIHHTNITYTSQTNVGVGTSTLLTSFPEDDTKYCLLSSENGDTIINGYNSVGIRLNDYFKWTDTLLDNGIAQDRINVDLKRDSIIKLKNAKYSDTEESISEYQNTSANESILELGVKYLDLFYYSGNPYHASHTAAIRWVDSIHQSYFCKIDRTPAQELRFVNVKDSGFIFAKNSTGTDTGTYTTLLTITNTATTISNDLNVTGATTLAKYTELEVPIFKSKNWAGSGPNTYAGTGNKWEPLFHMTSSNSAAGGNITNWQSSLNSGETNREFLFAIENTASKALGLFCNNEQSFDREDMASDASKFSLIGFFVPAAYGSAFSFTASHRCYSDNNELYNEDKIGLIVESTGQYDSLYIDNISVDNAVPIVELTHKKKSKCVLGVIAQIETDNNNRTGMNFGYTQVLRKDKNRLYINSIGEGCIWVCNSNGNFENGDYIQSSDILGYGEKQDDDFLHNYSVAKITMNIDFNNIPNRFQSRILDRGYIAVFCGCIYQQG